MTAAEPAPQAPAFDGTQPCRDNPGLFFPPVGGGNSPARREAVAICWGCRFREPCLTYALAARDSYGRPLDGIWGGTTKSQRAWLRTHPDATVTPPKIKTEPSIKPAAAAAPTPTAPRRPTVNDLGILKNAPAAAGPAPIRHGTRGGYQAHLRRSEPIPDGDPCGCRAANSRSNAAYRADQLAHHRAVTEETHRLLRAGVDADTATTVAPHAVSHPRPGPAAQVTARPLLPTDLDAWLTTAARHTSPTVRGHAARATARLDALRQALDDLARAERTASRRTA